MSVRGKASWGIVRSPGRCARREWGRIRETLAALVAGLSAASFVSAAPGDLDTTFGTSDGDGVDGVAFWDSGSGYDTGQSVVRQPDGKVLVAGFADNDTDYDFALVRFTADGALDTAFGTDGVAIWDSGGGDDRAYAAALQPDGRVLVAGDTDDGTGGVDIALARFTAGGALDTTFGAGDGDGTDGVTIWDGGGPAARAYSMVLQPDGRVLVAGYAHKFHWDDLALARFTGDGTLDTTFGAGDGDGVDGAAIWDGGNVDAARSVALQPDGRVLVAGYSDNGTDDDLILARFTTDGVLDTTFAAGDGDGTDGMAIWDGGGGDDKGYAVVGQPDGRVLVVGYADNGTDADFALIRFTAGGALDTAFGSGGAATWDSGSKDWAFSGALQPDGRVLVAGFAPNGADDDLALARFTAGGTLDTTFAAGDGDGTDGVAIWDSGNGSDYGIAVTLQPDGGVLVAGSANNGTDVDLALARFRAGSWGTVPWDTEPDAFSLTDQSGVKAGSSVTSETVVIGGLDGGIRVPVRTDNGGLTVLDASGAQVHSGAPFAWVGNSYSLQVSHTAADTGGGSVTSTVTAGGVRPAGNSLQALGPTRSASFTSTVKGSGGGGGGCTLAPGRPFDPALALLVLLAALGRWRPRAGATKRT